MTYYKRLKSFFILIFCLWSSFGFAQDNLKILIITGGHDFEEGPFFEMFDSFERIEYDSLSHPKANQIFLSDRINSYNGIVFYDMVNEISDEQKIALIDLFEKGTGAVFLHHSLAGYQNWDEYENIVGGRFYHESKTDTTGIILSTYRHEVEIPVIIADSSHPVVEGLEDFEIFDEVYGQLNILPSVHPLLTTPHPESNKQIAWTNEYGNSRIVYIQPGQDHNAYENPNYRKLVKQAIYWAAE